VSIEQRKCRPKKNSRAQNTFAEISFAGKPKIGDYLKQKIFIPGTSYQCNDLLKHATGEGLTAKYFANEFVGE